MKKYWFITLLGAAGIVFATYINRQRNLLSAFGYKIKNVTYLGTSNNNTKIEVQMKFTNTADFNIKVKKYQFDLIIDNKVVAKASDDQEYNIPAKGSVIIPVVANADTNLSLSLGIATIINQLVDKTPGVATLRGSLDVRAGIVTINNLPIDVTASTSDFIG